MLPLRYFQSSGRGLSCVHGALHIWNGWSNTISDEGQSKSVRRRRICRCKNRLARSERFGGRFAESLARSAEGISTSSSSAPLAHPRAQAFLRAAANVSAREVSTTTSERCCGCELTPNSRSDNQSCERRPDSMALARWRTYRERVQQKRKALRMLALSGVVRPSHIEPRYTVPLLQIRVWHHSHSAPTADATQQSAPPRHSAPAMTSQGTQLLHWLRHTGSLSRRILTSRAGTAENG